MRGNDGVAGKGRENFIPKESTPWYQQICS